MWICASFFHLDPVIGDHEKQHKKSKYVHLYSIQLLLLATFYHSCSFVAFPVAASTSCRLAKPNRALAALPCLPGFLQLLHGLFLQLFVGLFKLHVQGSGGLRSPSIEGQRLVWQLGT